MLRAWMGAACVLALAGGSAAARQQAAPARVFDQGPVVVISEIRVLPGSGAPTPRRWRGAGACRWRRRSGAARCSTTASTPTPIPRKGEGDLFVIITYRDAAVQDVPFAERERRAAEGSLPGVPAPIAPPETLYEVLNETMLREQVFRTPPPAPPGGR
jgi:hypothetical protein